MVFIPVPYVAVLQTGCVPSSAWGLPLSLPTVTSPHSDMDRALSLQNPYSKHTAVPKAEEAPGRRWEGL